MELPFTFARRLASAVCFALLLASPVWTMGSGFSAGSSSRTTDDALAPARKAIEAKDWARAIQLLEEQKTARPGDADVHNLLGFAERQRGNLDAAFAHYEKALQLNPKHRGAHEYVGEAWLLAGNLQKAEEHLAALDKLCRFSCEEYRDLKRKIAEYKKQQP
jgi:cytochrome c-type biogenesis protein CcmH/NrfG